ncbi:MAG: metalloregulator ArsR/SmtB family transcription factor [Desulfatiglandaceae bacterium]
MKSAKQQQTPSYPIQDTDRKSGLTPEALQTAAFMAKSLSDVNRLRILDCIRNGHKSVSAIVEELGLSQPLISHHLKELKHALLVKIQRKGPFIYYELSDTRVLDVIKSLHLLGGDLLSRRRNF